MPKSFAVALLATAALALSAPSAWAATPAFITAAVADAARPAKDAARDPLRKPAEMLVFSEVKPGDKVVDFITGGVGGGYFAKLFAGAVGPSGVVYAYEAGEFAQFYKGGLPASGSHPDARHPNITFLTGPVNSFTTPEKVDLIWTAQNYHDLHDGFAQPADLAKINRRLFDALKPGGVLIVLDHSAAEGSGLRDTDSLHRIDQAQVRKEIEAAGFRFVGESNALRRPDDRRTASVFDKAIAGHTDQFILKFRKPK